MGVFITTTFAPVDVSTFNMVPLAPSVTFQESWLFGFSRNSVFCPDIFNNGDRNSTLEYAVVTMVFDSMAVFSEVKVNRLLPHTFPVDDATVVVVVGAEVVVEVFVPFVALDSVVVVVGAEVVVEVFVPFVALDSVVVVAGAEVVVDVVAATSLVCESTVITGIVLSETCITNDCIKSLVKVSKVCFSDMLILSVGVLLSSDDVENTKRPGISFAPGASETSARMEAAALKFDPSDPDHLIDPSLSFSCNTAWFPSVSDLDFLNWIVFALSSLALVTTVKSLS